MGLLTALVSFNVFLLHLQEMYHFTHFEFKDACGTEQWDDCSPLLSDHRGNGSKLCPFEGGKGGKLCPNAGKLGGLI